MNDLDKRISEAMIEWLYLWEESARKERIKERLDEQKRELCRQRQRQNRTRFEEDKRLRNRTSTAHQRKH